MLFDAHTVTFVEFVDMLERESRTQINVTMSQRSEILTAYTVTQIVTV